MFTQNLNNLNSPSIKPPLYPTTRFVAIFLMISLVSLAVLFRYDDEHAAIAGVLSRIKAREKNVSQKRPRRRS